MCNKIMFKDYNNVRDIIKPNFIHLTALPSVAIKLKASRYTPVLFISVFSLGHIHLTINILIKNGEHYKLNLKLKQKLELNKQQSL